MGRIMGIDFGLKRIGIAITDPLKMFAQPLTTVFATDFPKWLSDYAKLEIIDEFVVGMPSKLSGEDTDATQPVRDFIIWLNSNYPAIPLATIDERLSSHEAQNFINKSVVKRENRKDKKLVDTISATLILQTHLQRIS
jgi:putative Holliday junction resolvase